MTGMKQNDIIKRLGVNRITDFGKIAARYHLASSNPRFMTIVMDISNKCNLRCRMCYFSFDRYFKVKPVYLLPGQFEKMASVLLPNAAALTLSCGNEPLTSPYFVDILEIASKYRVPHIDFATNGMLLNEEKVEAIIKYGVTEVLLSVDAARKQTYEHIRRGANFDRLIETIKYLVKQKKVLKSQTPRLRFNITLMKTNITQMEELVVLAHELGVSQLDFRHLIVYAGLDMEDESLGKHKQLSNYNLDKAVKKAKELGMAVVAFPGYFKTGEDEVRIHESNINPFRLRNVLERFKTNPGYVIKTGYYRVWDRLRAQKMKYYFKTLKKPPFPYCRLPFSYVLINTGGFVYPCPYCHGESSYGNLFSASSFKDIWFGDPYKNLRRRILENDPPDMCRKCPNFGPGSENREVFEARVINVND
jgi:radical SAM protein with 4Fe4S-binding SPASM domain